MFTRLADIAVGEITGPVFFGGQVSAPGGVAVGTVVNGATGQSAGGAELGFHLGVATGRAGDFHFSQSGNTAVVAATHHFPVRATHDAALNFHHGHTVSGHFFQHFILRAWCATGACGVQYVLIDVFVVDAQNAVGRRTIDREEVHTIVVHAHLLQRFGAGVQAVIAVRRVRTGNRRTPGNQRCPLIASRQGNGIGTGSRNGAETNARHFIQAIRRNNGSGFIIGGTASQIHAHHAHRRGTHNALQQRAARKTLLHNGINMRIGRVVRQRLVAVVVQHVLHAFIQHGHGISLNSEYGCTPAPVVPGSGEGCNQRIGYWLRKMSV